MSQVRTLRLSGISYLSDTGEKQMELELEMSAPRAQSMFTVPHCLLQVKLIHLLRPEFVFHLDWTVFCLFSLPIPFPLSFLELKKSTCLLMWINFFPSGCSSYPGNVAKEIKEVRKCLQVRESTGTQVMSSLAEVQIPGTSRSSS